MDDGRRAPREAIVNEAYRRDWTVRDADDEALSFLWLLNTQLRSVQPSSPSAVDCPHRARQ